jgi:hypothetical protein
LLRRGILIRLDLLQQIRSCKINSCIKMAASVTRVRAPLALPDGKGTFRTFSTASICFGILEALRMGAEG